MTDSPDGPSEAGLLVIEPSRGWHLPDWQELWRYRELLYFLAWRDVKVRYKQTLLGAAWAVLQPVMMMVVFYLFFGRLAGLAEKTGSVPYPIFVFAGLLPWTFFASAVAASGNSLVGGSHLITKVYFPRLVIPLAAVGAASVDLAVALVSLAALMACYALPVSWQIAAAPLFLAAMMLTATGVGALLSALTVAYRDFRHVVPFMLQLWMFVTPVIYPTSIVPDRWRWLMYLNPMSGPIDGFRATLLGGPLSWGHAALSLAAGVLLFFGGATYFRTVERRFADII